MGYQEKIATANSWGNFFKLMCRWRGSVYKMLWLDILIWILLWYVINFIYRFGLSPEQRALFEKVVIDFGVWGGKISVSVFVGFFVSGVISRYWSIFNNIPWLNYASFMVQSIVYNKEEPRTAKGIRITTMRYLNLSWIFAMREISVPLRKRFQASNTKLELEAMTPEKRFRNYLQQLNSDQKIKDVFGKIITTSEIDSVVELALKGNAQDPKVEWWLPLHWATRLLNKALFKGFIADTRSYMNLIDVINNFRGMIGTLIIYSDTTLPLLYSQVALIGVYTVYLLDTIAKQAIQPKTRTVGYYLDIPFPIFTVLNLIFLLGWFKVALVLLNPFGDDDDDFQTNEIFDYNMTHSNLSGGNRPEIYPSKLRQSTQDTGPDDNLDADLRRLDSDDSDDDEVVQSQLAWKNHPGF